MKLLLILLIAVACIVSQVSTLPYRTTSIIELDDPVVRNYRVKRQNDFDTIDRYLYNSYGQSKGSALPESTPENSNED
ncbi:AAEL002283-PA [Aedes aegypti]|uniref:AAEL002283-PA n=1 Tax=Aedes aegypti TaxID=7159 RepID=Q17IN3_AEDAE|nr:AAEL002283-PA [Aedes aegypti]